MVPPLVQTYFAIYLTAVGRAPEAVQKLELALRQDPLNFLIRAWRHHALMAAGRYEDAGREARETLDLNPDSWNPNLMLAFSYLQQGEASKALPLLERAYSLFSSHPTNIGLLAGALHLTGDVQRAEEILQRLPADASGGPRARANFYGVCGNTDATAEWLEKAIDQRDPSAPFLPRILHDRLLRGSPHWARLMRKLNLPEN